MRLLLQKAAAYLPHVIVTVIVSLAAVLGYQHYAVHNAIKRAGQAGEMAVLGNPGADVTLVSYIDYNCPACGKGGRAIKNVLDNRRDVRVIIRPLPMLGKKSGAVAKLAIAAALQGNFKTYHHALLDEMARQKRDKQGKFTIARAEALRIAREAGVNSQKLDKTARDERVQAILSHNVETAETLDIWAVPTYIIGERLYTPYYETPKPDDFHRMLDAVKSAS